MKTQSHQKIIHAWCMYDWAMSAFHTTIMAAFLPLFFRHVATVNLSEIQNNLATSLWGYTMAIAMLIVAMLSLVLGPLADYGSSKKRFLALFIGLGTVSTFFLTFLGPGDWLWVALFFIFGNIGITCGEVFYDALLPHIAEPYEIDRVSTRGYALGYIGGGLLLILNLGMIYILPKTIILSGQEPVPLLGMRLSFLSVAVWWGVFSVPLFRYVSEPKGVQIGLSGENPIRVALYRLSTTFCEIRQYKQLLFFIIAFWLYNDGIGTIIKMAIAFGDEIGIGTMDLIGALILTQVLGVPFTLGFGKLAGYIGAKKAILLGLCVYVGVTIGGYFITKAIHFWILAFFVGLVQGGTQALSRSLYGSMVPKKKSAEFFGFYNISGKFAGIAGPAIFGLVGQLTQSSRLGILSLVFFFIIGGLLLLPVNIEEGRRIALNENSK